MASPPWVELSRRAAVITDWPPIADLASDTKQAFLRRVAQAPSFDALDSDDQSLIVLSEAAKRTYETTGQLPERQRNLP